MKKLLLILTLVLGMGVNAQEFVFGCAWDSGYNYDNTVWVAYDSDYPYWADIEGYNDDGSGVITAYVGGKESGVAPQGYTNFPSGIKYVSATPQHMDWILQAHSEFLHDGFDAAIAAARETIPDWSGPGARGLAGKGFGAFSYVLENGKDYKIAFKVNKYSVKFYPVAKVVPTIIEWRAWLGEHADGYEDDTHVITSTGTVADLISNIDAYVDQE